MTKYLVTDLFALSALLIHVGEGGLGRRLRRAIMDCLAQGHITRDLGGRLGTDVFPQAVIDSFRKQLSGAAC